MDSNLLLWREKFQRKRLQYLLLRCMFYVTANIIFLMTLQIFFTHRIHNLQHAIFQLDQSAKKIILQQTAKNHAQLLQQLNTLYPKQKKTIARNKIIRQVLVDIANDLPSTLTLSALSITEKTVQLNGFGELLSDMHHYSRALRRSGLHNVTLSAVQKNQQASPQFHFLMRAKMCSTGK